MNRILNEDISIIIQSLQFARRFAKEAKLPEAKILAALQRVNDEKDTKKDQRV